MGYLDATCQRSSMPSLSHVPSIKSHTHAVHPLNLLVVTECQWPALPKLPLRISSRLSNVFPHGVMLKAKSEKNAAHKVVVFFRKYHDMHPVNMVLRPAVERSKKALKNQTLCDETCSYSRRDWGVSPLAVWHTARGCKSGQRTSMHRSCAERQPKRKMACAVILHFKVKLKERENNENRNKWPKH